MIKSMTGYGKATAIFEGKTISVEIKSLNSKQLDIYVRIPNIYKEKEIDIRQLISQFSERGRIECIITIENNNELSPLKLNAVVIKDYFHQINSIATDLQIKVTDRLLATILRLPDSMSIEEKNISEQEWLFLKNTLIEALHNFDDYRNQEGSILFKDILQRIEIIDSYISEIEPFERQRIEKLRERFHNNLIEVVTEKQIDQNRFEQEMIYYLEKIDITEEKVRLRNHCKYFISTLKENVSNGRKLSFIAQEMGREINTIGSKANDFEIQRIVVLMKDELEKIKEQLANIL